MRGGSPSHLGGPGEIPRKNLENRSAREAFLACFWYKFQVSNLISKASLTYFMQYFASVSAYTGTVAGIESKKKGNDQELRKYLINDCSSFLWWPVCAISSFRGEKTPREKTKRRKNAMR